ncbi:hypothetical protein [Moorena sp. SIO4G3]|uniref:hypothetical protein n=1 Tax=Moorena sp. SIO4G3 TaxID=2607821 RepID=UPI0025FEF851|nr:hypothetical protein [Moorena sp. SIO4G3]
MQRRDLLFKYGVPGLLATVALVQQYASHQLSLTPWKGGGFGMFSTLDSPAARFLRIYIVTDKGKTQVNLPKWLGKLATEVRTIPTKNRLLRLTRELAQSQWISYASPSSEPPTFNASERDTSRNYLSNLDSEAPDLIDRQSQVQLQIQRLTQLLPPEVLKKGKSLPSKAEFVAVKEVQVEVWQYMFDPESSQVKAHKLSSSVVKRLS